MNTFRKSLVIFFVFCLAVQVFAGSIQEYTADMVDVSSGKTVQKIAVTPDKIYSETLSAQGKREAMCILRLDQRKMFIIMEETKTYMEIPFNKDRFTASDLAMGMVQSKQEKVGSETVSGYDSDKFRITSAVMGKTVTSYQWVAPEFEPMPIRTETNGKAQEMRNINPGRPSASMFEVPGGYKRDTNMEQMMKGMMGL